MGEEEILDGDLILGIHQRVLASGVDPAVLDLIEREPLLAGYIIHTAIQLVEMMRNSGVSREVMMRVQECATLGSLVAVQSVFEGQYRLWRDFMGDAPEVDEHKGGTNE